MLRAISGQHGCVKPFAIEPLRDAGGPEEKTLGPEWQKGPEIAGPKTAEDPDLSPELNAKAKALVQLLSQKRVLESRKNEDAAALPGSCANAKLDVARPLRGASRPAALPTAGDYKPGTFKEAFQAYLTEKKNTGMKHREAVEAWMISNERATFLESVPASEMKRRRFS